MSSLLETFISGLQWSNYGSLAMLTPIVYDYVLVLPKEIEYIWNKPWTWVSTLFILVRYFGLLKACAVLHGTSFVPGPNALYQGAMIYMVQLWSYLPFLGAADFTMILRVWVMYNRSRPVLGILLVLFFIEILSFVVYYSFTSKIATWSTVQLLEYSYCIQFAASPEVNVMEQVNYYAQILFSTVLCMLAITQFMRQSIQIYHMTKKWEPNQYLDILVKQGVAYFLVLLPLNIVNILVFWGVIASTEELWLLAPMVFVPLINLPPRFIISIREMYEHDVQDRNGNGIDSGFGLSTTLSDRGAARSQIEFASHNENEPEENLATTENRGTDVGEHGKAGDIQMVPIARDIESGS